MQSLFHLYSRFAFWLVVWGVTALGTSSFGLTTVSEDFAEDPFWTSFNSSAVNDNYGYSATTNHAGGGAGEVGGLFGRHDAFDSYYADTDLGGTLSAKDMLTSSGKISIDGSLSPSFPTNIAFFDQSNPSKGGNALRINIAPGGQFMLWLRLEIGKNLQSPVQTGLVSGDYTWTMNWNPTGNGGLGTGTVTFQGVSPGTPASRSVTLNIPLRNEGSKPEWLQEPIYFNAFGLQNYDGEATTSGQYRVYVDDVTYSVVNAPAANSNWGLPQSGDWATSRNWTPGEVPFGNDRTAKFGSGVTQNSTVFVDRDITIKSIQFDNASYQFAVAGTGKIKLDADSGPASITVINGAHELQTPIELLDTANVSTNAAGSLEFDGVVAFNGQTMNVAAGSHVKFQNVGDSPSGGLVSNSGTLGGAGRINAALDNLAGGVVAPGEGVGTLRVDGQFVQAEASSLAIEIGGSGAAEYDHLLVFGDAMLNGSLVVSLANGYTPAGNKSFAVLTAAGGIVDNGIVLEGPAANEFSLNIVGQTVLLSAGLLGDYNDDGSVDAADYTVWRDSLGSTVDLQADGNGNEIVDADDYAIWRAKFGATSGGGAGTQSTSAVPEPAGWTLCLLVCGLVSLIRIRDRQPGSIPMCVTVVLLTLALQSALQYEAAASELIGNSFSVNPAWQGNDNIVPQGDPNKARDDFNNYGYSQFTSNAFGSAGEIGGYFGMNTFDSYYADTTLGGSVGGSFPLKQVLHAGGKLMVNSDHGPTWNMNIGFFDATDYSNSLVGAQEGGSGDAIRFAIIEQSPDFRIRLEIRQNGNGYNGPVLAGPAGLLDGMYTWSMDYNPTGGTSGTGRLSLEMRGPTTISTFVDVDNGGKNIAMNLNAFGFTNYNSGVSRPATNKHFTFLDDLTYSTNETADTDVAWAGARRGSWTDAPSWSSTSRTDGAGFVPNGNDRRALFGSNIAGDALIAVDQIVKVRDVEFDNAAHSYAVVGTGTVLLDSNAGGPATIQVTSGDHQFQSRVRLATDAEIASQTGTQLNFNNALELDGHTLTLTGSGQVNINNVLDVGAGGSLINMGQLGGSGGILGDLTSAGILSVALADSRPDSGLTVSGTASLSGVLNLTTFDGRTLTPGQQFTVLTARHVVDSGLRLAPEDVAHYRLIVGPNLVQVQTVVPEPATWLLGTLVAALLAAAKPRSRTRRAR